MCKKIIERVNEIVYDKEHFIVFKNAIRIDNQAKISVKVKKKTAEEFAAHYINRLLSDDQILLNHVNKKNQAFNIELFTPGQKEIMNYFLLVMSGKIKNDRKSFVELVRKNLET